MPVLLQYSFTGNNLTPTTVAPGVFGDASTNSVLTGVTGSPGYTSDPVRQAVPPAGTTTAALAIANDCYQTYTITPDPGTALFLTSITWNGARGGASTPRGYDLRSSVDGYAATLGTANYATVRPTFAAVSIDLSGPAFQNVGTAITFRLYMFCPTAVSLDYDDLTINGDTAVNAQPDQAAVVVAGKPLTLGLGILLPGEA